MPQPAAGVISAINAAARATGASASYLTAAAQRESGFDPAAEAATSSASGLFQFIESTWLATLDRHADALGVGALKALTRDEALALRFDPKLSALMAGALASDNAEALSRAIGRAPTDGELYAAHVLGANGAGRLITARAADPAQPAAALFPAAAAANKNLFYAPDGTARSVDALYARLTKHDDAPAPVAHPGAVDAAGPERKASARTSEGFGGGLGGAGSLKLTPQTLEILALLDAPERASDRERSERSGSGRAASA